MHPLALHDHHAILAARFTEVRGAEAVAHYGDWRAEHAAIRDFAGLLDLGFRGRLCLTGNDRIRLLNGQVTNDIKALEASAGCYAAFCGPKGRLVADAHIYRLPDELLVEFEPGLTATLIERLEHHIVAEDVQVIDVAPYYGLLSVQGPSATRVVESLGRFGTPPSREHQFTSAADSAWGDLYLMRRGRTGGTGYDLFIPIAGLELIWDELMTSVRKFGGRTAGFTALEAARFEAGIPRFGVEMNETHLPPEAGLDRTAISYTKGCYTGQETIARLRTYGQVTKALRGLHLTSEPNEPPKPGDVVQLAGRNVGQVVNSLRSPTLGQVLSLAYVRKECNAPGTELVVVTASGALPAVIVPLPFVPPVMTLPSAA